MKYILISLLLISSFLFANDKTTVYNQKDALRISNINNTVVFTGLKNRGLFKLVNNKKQEIISDSKIIVSFYKNNGKLNIKTNDGHYLYDGKILSEVNALKLIVKQIEKNIYIKKNNSWLKISPNNGDLFYAPRQKNNLILFSGLKTGLLVYNIDTKTTNFISKGVDASFSDNGKNIVFAKVYDDGEKYTGSEIFSYNIETKKVINLSKNSSFRGLVGLKRFPYLINNTLYLNIDLNIFEINLEKE